MERARRGSNQTEPRVDSNGTLGETKRSFERFGKSVKKPSRVW
ncbi:hypothetical protein Z950_3234 [Sulfitobacter mediterraneus KCTC 32188]|nr:hypothetical protein Z950_3234 [Sulfitobacter mediterraneus KCTC 32188]